MTTLLSFCMCFGLASVQVPNTPEPSQLDPRFTAPPPPNRTGPKLLIAAGAALIVAGVTGLAFKPDCRTYDERRRCVDPYAGETVFPAMIVLGLGTTITGSYWYRRAEQQSSQ